MRNYYTEHPAIVVPPWVHALVSAGMLEDHSWHNDTCCRFQSADGRYALWVDHYYPRDRKVGSLPRFVISECFDGTDTGKNLLETESERDVTRWLLAKLLG